VTALALSTLVVAAFALLGFGLDRTMRLGLAAHGPWRVPLGALVALTLSTLGWLHPVLGVVVLVLVVAARPPAVASPRTTTPPTLWAGVAAALLVGVARPMAPRYWDEYVWLSKARLATHGYRVLVDAALAQETLVVPRGYPLGWPLAEALLAGLSPGTASLAAGAFVLSALCLGLYAAMLARSGRGLVVLGVMAAAPLAWVHWRSAYVDLPLGLLSASVALALMTARAGDGASMPVAVAAAALAGSAKDEGALHIVAVVAALVATGGWRLRAERIRLAWVAAAGVAPGVVWWAMRHGAGVANTDHAPSGLALAQVYALLRQTVWHLADVQSWGIVSAVALAATLLALRRAPTRTLALALLFAAGLLGAVLLVTPERVRAFALNGTLLSRLALQLLPLAAVVVADALLPPRATPSPAD